MERILLSKQVPIITGDPFATLCGCGAFYNCPKDPEGKRLGKLVVYAKKYEPPGGGKELNMVGDVYANIAMVEENPHVLAYFAGLVAKQIVGAELDFTAVVGAPMGGVQFSGALGRELDCRVIYAEKEVTEVGSTGSREKSTLVFGRHKIRKGDKVLIVEDICNNFSTTMQLIELIRLAGGEVVGIVCVLNRSSFESEWTGDQGRIVLPVFSGVHREMPQYTQENEEVATDVQAGNIEFHVKPKWDELMDSMRKAAQT